MRELDVVVQRTNGSYRAIVLALPNVAAEGQSREEVLANVRKAAEDFLATADMATITVDLPVQGTFNDPVPEFPLGSPKALLKTISACRIDPADPLYQEYVANLETEEKRQQEEAAEEAELETHQYPLAEAWARRAGLRRKDPDDPVYQSYLASLEAAKQQDREEARREAEQAAQQTA